MPAYNIQRSQRRYGLIEEQFANSCRLEQQTGQLYLSEHGHRATHRPHSPRPLQEHKEEIQRLLAYEEGQ